MSSRLVLFRSLNSYSKSKFKVKFKLKFIIPISFVLTSSSSSPSLSLAFVRFLNISYSFRLTYQVITLSIKRKLPPPLFLHPSFAPLTHPSPFHVETNTARHRNQHDIETNTRRRNQHTALKSNGARHMMILVQSEKRQIAPLFMSFSTSTQQRTSKLTRPISVPLPLPIPIPKHDPSPQDARKRAYIRPPHLHEPHLGIKPLFPLRPLCRRHTCTDAFLPRSIFPPLHQRAAVALVLKGGGDAQQVEEVGFGAGAGPVGVVDEGECVGEVRGDEGVGGADGPEGEGEGGEGGEEGVEDDYVCAEGERWGAVGEEELGGRLAEKRRIEI